ncbi:putative defense protein 3 [Haliotis rufescens]|uniref:putative defense protein 3 n=1 Tax=Haliotis rufescens TaxID=6454 RepID=UPI001EAFD758|nr:putative defense protein 3 [Haliotis rufescens]
MVASLTLAFCLSAVTCVFAFPNGAPAELCGSPLGRPMHNETLPQSTCSPFQIVVNATEYGPEQPINITIHGNGLPFRGFLVTADTTTGMFDGTCLNTSADAKAVPNCGMTHSSSVDKTSVTLLWYPPTIVHVGSIQFKLVVVKEYSTYWSDVRSSVLTPSKTGYYSLTDMWELGWFNPGSSLGGHNNHAGSGRVHMPSAGRQFA